MWIIYDVMTNPPPNMFDTEGADVHGLMLVLKLSVQVCFVREVMIGLEID